MPIIIAVVEVGFENLDPSFQQDGTHHFHLPVRDYLIHKFSDRWIKKHGLSEWPTQSPDLTLNEFFLLRLLKNILYRTQFHNFEQLRQRISDACHQVVTHSNNH